METSEIQERVARGAALLDEKLPGWHERLDTTDLRVSTPSQCVMHRLFGGYSGGLVWVGLSAGSPAEHGFACCPDEDEYYLKAWDAEVTRRYLDA